MGIEVIVSICSFGFLVFGTAIGLYIKNRVEMATMKKDIISVLVQANQNSHDIKQLNEKMNIKIEEVKDFFHQGFNELKDLFHEAIQNQNKS